MKILPAALALLAATVQMAAQDRSTITGRFLDDTGNGATRSSVAIFEFGGDGESFIDTAVVAADGSFTLHSERSALLGVRVLGPQGLIWFLPPVWIRGEKLGMTIRMKPLSPGVMPEDPDVLLDDPIAMGIYSAYASADGWRHDFMRAALTHQMSGEPMESFAFDFTPAYARVDSILAATPPGIVRDAWTLASFSLGEFDESKPVDTSRVRRAFSDIPATSILWAVFPEVGISAGKSIGEIDRYRPLLDSIAGFNPILSARATWLYQLARLGAAERDTARLLGYIHRLERDFPTSYRTRAAHAEVDPNRAINVGRKVPSFSFISLDDSTEIITDRNMLGRYYLIDFWATWCSPCVAELGGLHRAYNRFREKRFEVLSLSFDQSPGTVTQFRKRGRFPMPWKHAFIEGRYENPVADIFNVTGIPHPILVGPDGTILETSPGALRGEELERTLAKYLGD